MNRRRTAFVFATSAIACLAGSVYGCSSDDAPPGPTGTDAGNDVVDSSVVDTGKDAGRADDAGGCGTAPGLGSNPESKCNGKLGQPTPEGTGAAAGEPCTSEADCLPFCAACTDGGTFVSSVAICRCGKCGTAAETSEAFQGAFPCKSQ